MSEEFKEVIRHINRAKAYVNKFEAIRTMQCIVDALELLMKSNSIFGRERFELEILLGEVLRTLASMDEMRNIFPKGLSYKKGQEKTLHGILTKVLKTISEAIEKAEIDKFRKRKNEIDRYMLQGQKLLDEKNFIEARKVLRRTQELFADEPGINQDIGQRLFKAGLAPEALEFFEAAIRQDNRDPRPYSYMINVQESLGELEKAEHYVKEAFKNFGGNERIYLRMAQLAVKLRKWDEAFDAAQQVLELNPYSQEAMEVMKQAKPRVFGRGADGQAAGGQGGSGQPIKFDI
ncbi:tetratricopeptide repeat protein [Desulfocurvibacter africanus]|uniref:tetratricopeptide repeat protein n=1 Tax=Desulfocurvibacter africanus TaxID=873 RepID=UPI00040A2D18|nr:tetratricopeptide repeat protein [Desulfocurvibacter africanus]